jgi:SAM-dependent methyltransferase
VTSSSSTDAEYLRTRQYADSTKLRARVQLHRKYATAEVRWFPWVLAQIDWRAGAQVLEIGCGPGWMWSQAGEVITHDLHLTLTDLSPGMVDEAVARAAAAFPEATVTGREVDAMALPFDDGSFDIALAMHMLYHVPSPATAVAELARVLRPDGVAVVTTLGEGHLAELWAIRDEVFGTNTLADLRTSFGHPGGAAILGESFDEVTWHLHPEELRCTDAADVVAYILSTPGADDATDAQQGQVADLVAGAFQRGDGVFTVGASSGAYVCRHPRRSAPT